MSSQAIAPAKFPVTFRKIFTPALLGCLACITAVTAILYWRRPDAFYNPQLWAEDGSRFFSSAFFRGSQSLVLPFAGYFHTLARLVAWFGSWLPVRYVPHWYVIASWMLLACIVAYLFSGRFSFGWKTKFLIGLALVATAADNEVFFNLANWATLISVIWLLLSISREPLSRRQFLFDMALLVLTGLNSPFVVCFWLLFLLRWGTRRTRYSLYLLVASIVVAVVQVWNMPGRIQDGGVLPALASPFAFLDVLMYRFGFMFAGEQVYQLQPTDALRFFGLLATGAFYGGLLWHAARKQNWSSLTIVLGGLLATLLSLYVMRHHPNDMLYSAGRHFFIPVVTVAWGLLLSDVKPPYLRWAPLTLMFAAFLALTPGSKNQVWADLDWAGQTAQCAGTRPVCKIPVNPVWNPPVWFATMDSHVFSVPAISNPMAVRFGDQIELLGYDETQSPTAINLTLVWRASAKMRTDYRYFVHVVSSGDPAQILVQEDRTPLDSQYPTSKWVASEVITDQIALSLSALQPGEYRVGLGWYDPNAPDVVRLPAQDSSTGTTWDDDRMLLPLKIMVP
jgi:hypothetical protein